MMKVRIEFSKTGMVRFTSHRDMMRIIFRSIRRSGLPVAFSKGFSPHYRVSFGEPLKVGIGSKQEWMDMILEKQIGPEKVKERLSNVFPNGFSILSVTKLLPNANSIVKSIKEIEYTFSVPEEAEDLMPDFMKVLGEPELQYTVTGRNAQVKTLDLAKWVCDCSLFDSGVEKQIRIVLKPVNGTIVSPICFTGLFNEEAGKKLHWEINRTRIELA